MVQKKSSLFLSLVFGFLMLQSLGFVFSQPQDTASSEGAVQVLLGRDSPNLGGNTFRDAFIAMTLSDSLGVAVGKIINEISFSSTAGIAFDRGELTPDVEAAGATIEVETGEAAGDMSTVRITISSAGPLPDGIIANLVFKVIKEFTLEEVGNEEHIILLENQVTVFASSDEEISQVLSEDGGVDLAYAPVVFACFFYMH
jgi:hypothetical protein